MNSDKPFQKGKSKSCFYKILPILAIIIFNPKLLFSLKIALSLWLNMEFDDRNQYFP
jgi:hypothetical protein